MATSTPSEPSVQWSTESPGDSAVTGDYTFDHADLNTIKGIGGILSSTGRFQGQLNRIAVEGTTEVPNFSLDTANHSMPLHTRYSAVVDGTTGDTYLQPVAAKLGESEFICRGAVVNVKGRGHIIDLDVDVPQAASRTSSRSPSRSSLRSCPVSSKQRRSSTSVQAKRASPRS